MSKLIPMTFLALVLAGCGSGAIKNEAPGAASAAAGLNPQQARISDSRILADRETIEAVQKRLRKLNEGGIPQNNYSLAKAQCWLDTAKTQYHENDRTGYIEESLTESMKIVQALEADRNAKAGYDTPLVARSSKLRDDLWATLGNYKSQASTLSCTARTVACAEVRLVRAGHAEEQTGWRQATPHVQMVEDAVRRAGIEAASCAQPAAPLPVAAAAGPGPASATAAQGVSRETYVILADTLFMFDKFGRDQMLPGGLQRLGAVADRLKAYKSIQTLTIVGHTDRLGGNDYNDKLSKSRADTVKAYLYSLGVKAEKFDARGAGEREPVTKDCRDTQSRASLIQCLQPDRRVTIEVTGVAK